MDVGGKRWPTQRCAGTAVPDNTIINRIMLRFRPIAPKPVPDGSVTGSFPGENKAEMVTKPRAKRKYVRVKKNRKCSKINKEHDVDKRDLNFNDGSGGGAVVNLGQMEEDMARNIKFFPGIMGTSTTTFSETLMSFSVQEKSRMISTKLDESDRSGAVVVESWVVVEGMSEMSWLDVGRLGSTDRERMKNLEEDTCPGLISDSLHRVQWVNLAYKKMVTMNGQEENNSNINNNKNNNGNNNNISRRSGAAGGEEEVVVWLVVKENTPVIWPVFACTVRVVYTCRKEKHSQTMPCDVWKMDFGGFAWRLDAKAALSLGRPISC